jgi:hypothetical protein
MVRIALSIAIVSSAVIAATADPSGDTARARAPGLIPIGEIWMNAFQMGLLSIGSSVAKYHPKGKA